MCVYYLGLYSLGVELATKLMEERKDLGFGIPFEDTSLNPVLI